MVKSSIYIYTFIYIYIHSVRVFLPKSPVCGTISLKVRTYKSALLVLCRGASFRQIWAFWGPLPRNGKNSRRPRSIFWVSNTYCSESYWDKILLISITGIRCSDAKHKLRALPLPLIHAMQFPNGSPKKGYIRILINNVGDFPASCLLRYMGWWANNGRFDSYLRGLFMVIC